MDNEGTVRSFKTRKEFEEKGIGCCYYCFRTVFPEDVEEYTDKGLTVICPFCFVDSVVPGSVPETKLKRWHKYGWGF